MRRPNRSFPLEPLLRAMGMDAETYQPLSRANRKGDPRKSYHEDLAAIFRVPVTTVNGWLIRRTLSEPNADRAAVAAGMHPGDVWPDWWACR